ncbi:MAG: hypothetical protein OEU91_07120 [Gammaproteobacteria bacterium]|nr:hypothetical protein [Gammaproteobacteria bacterium]
MNSVIKYSRLIGLAAILSVSNAAYAACSFDVNVPSGYTAPDGVSDLSGQGNIACADFIGSDGQPMTSVGVVFQRNGDWELPASEQVIDINGFVTNTPDQVLEFPQGNGSRCNFSYFRDNAVKSTGLDIGGNVDTNDSIACTDGIVNKEEVILPEPDLVTTTSDGCSMTLEATTPNGSVDENDFLYFTGASLDGTIQAICNAGGVTQYECVKECPGFKNIDDLQDMGYCQADPAGWMPLDDPSIPTTASPDTRCTPCLTAAQAEATIPGYDTDGLNLCWQHTNSVNQIPGKYRPHKPVRSQTTDTSIFNECYQTTTTVYFFGRPRPTTVTTCD